MKKQEEALPPGFIDTACADFMRFPEELKREKKKERKRKEKRKVVVRFPSNVSLLALFDRGVLISTDGGTIFLKLGEEKKGLKLKHLSYREKKAVLLYSAVVTLEDGRRQVASAEKTFSMQPGVEEWTVTVGELEKWFR